MTDTAASISVAPEMLAEFLAPYKASCRYLERLTVEHPAPQTDEVSQDATDKGPLAWATGDFHIPETFYIDSTGHFNAVEFNLCFNQIMYVLFAQCVASGLAGALGEMTLDEYRRRQLPDVLIHDFHSRFKRPIQTPRFQGRMDIDSVLPSRRFLLIRTSIRFWNEDDGHAEGKVKMAIVME